MPAERIIGSAPGNTHHFQSITFSSSFGKAVDYEPELVVTLDPATLLVDPIAETDAVPPVISTRISFPDNSIRDVQVQRL